jgi:hypothetical protein
VCEICMNISFFCTSVNRCESPANNKKLSIKRRLIICLSTAKQRLLQGSI